MTWEKVKLGKIANTSSGGTPSRSNEKYWNGNIPWMKSGQLKDNTILNCNEYITKLGLENSSARIVSKGTLLLALYGATAGKLAFSGIDAATNQAICAIEPDTKKVNNRYLFYFLLSLRSRILKDATGGAQPNISQAYVKQIDVPLPPLHIQEQIANTLDKADMLRRKDRELLTKYDELTQAIFNNLFGDPVKNERGWDLTELGDVCENFKYGTNAKSDDIKNDGTVPVIRIPNVLNDKVSFTDLKYGKLTEKEWIDSKLRRGDLLFVRTNGNPANIGRCAVFDSELDVSYASYLIRARFPEVCLLRPQFIQSVISNVSYRSVVLKLATTTAGNYNINTQALKQLQIIIPPILLQEHFLKAYSLIQKQVSISQHNSLNSQEILDKKLAEYFS